MNTNQVMSYLNVICKTRKAVFDVIPCDELRNVKLVKFPLCLVVNTDPSTKPGDHWVALYIENKTSCVEFFDSYGFGIKYYAKEFKEFAIRCKRRLRENTRQLQNCGSVVCGNYALYFLYKRLKGCSPMNLYCSFTNNFANNDKYVAYFISSKQYLLNSNC